MRDDHNGQSVRLGDIRDCGVRNLFDDGVVIANPGKEQSGRDDGVKPEVDGKNGSLKVAELLPSWGGYEMEDSPK